MGYDALDVKELVNLVFRYNIELVIDVRRWGRSVRIPQYSVNNLQLEFERVGVDYAWMRELGGYRRFGTELADVGMGRCFKSEGFRAYATYILTSIEARSVLEMLLRMCSYKTAALLCRERIPYRCHRKILSDWLLYRGFAVVHIVPPYEFKHRYTRCAKIVEGELTYV